VVVEAGSGVIEELDRMGLTTKVFRTKRGKATRWAALLESDSKAITDQRLIAPALAGATIS